MSRTLDLHGSAVARGGRAHIFTGASGRGKSTIAALMARAGWDFVGDEPLRIELGPPVRVLPGPRSIRLTEELARTMKLGGRAEPDGKVRWDVTEPAVQAEVGVIAVLEVGESDRVSEVAGADRVALLLAASFGMTSEGARLERCTELAAVRVVRLVLRRDLADLAGRVERLLSASMTTS